MGQALTASVDASINFDSALVRRVPPQLPARGVDIDGAAGRAAAPVPVAPSAVAGPVVDVSWSVPQVEPEEVIVRLQSERAAVRGGFSHPHAAADCAFCRRAVAAYR